MNADLVADAMETVSIGEDVLMGPGQPPEIVDVTPTTQVTPNIPTTSTDVSSDTQKVTLTVQKTATSGTKAVIEEKAVVTMVTESTSAEAGAKEPLAAQKGREHPMLHGLKRMFGMLPHRTGQKKSKVPGDSDSDSEEERMRYMTDMMRMEARHGRQEPSPRTKELLNDPRARRDIRRFGHLAFFSHPPPPDLDEVERPPPSDVWQEPRGCGYDGPEAGWTTPESTDIWHPLDDAQVVNYGGGYVYEVDDLTRVRRLFCLGSEGGTFYTNALDLTLENTEAVKRLLEAKKGEDLVKEIITFSGGRVAKMNSLLFVLAMCAQQGEHLSTKQAAYRALPKVCHIPTHLFIFMEYYNQLRTTHKTPGRGWGRAHRYGVSNWYTHYKNNPMKLAQHVTKYRQRNGWSHRDVIRMSHPKSNSQRGSPGLAAVLKYVVKGPEAARESYMTDDPSEHIQKLFAFLDAVEAAKKLKPADYEAACSLIAEHRLVREHLPTELLNSVPVWRALLQNMPMTALVRNLGKMTSIGLLTGGSADVPKATEKLTNHEQLRGARMHPFNVLRALNQYQQGHGDRGSLNWRPNHDVTLALEEAFYLSFKAVEPTNKRFCIALDISSSMDFNDVLGMPMSVRGAAAAMAMVTVRTEKRHRVVGFHHDLIDLTITPDMTLDEVIAETKRYNFGMTDCSKPMLWAKENKKLFDVFLVYTDSETNKGAWSPAEALRQYRRASGIHDAKLIVVAMCSNGFTIADPTDRHMLDVVGFDSNAPEIISNFAEGKI